MHPVEAAAAQALAELSISDAKLAIGFSGGGDSTALLYALRARANNIRVFIVDHNLRKGSDVEAQLAKTRAQKWGYRTDILTWDTEPIHSAIQNKARRARYGLIGAKMREEGLTHLLTGHTVNDQAETCLMRYQRGTNWRGAAGIAPRVYAPVWPELVGVTVLRPLMMVSRAQLRTYICEHNLEWCEDPSNENRDFTRIRARDYLKERPQLNHLLLETALDLQEGVKQERAHIQDWISAHAALMPDGYIMLNRVPPSEVLFNLVRVVSGQGQHLNRVGISSTRGMMSRANYNGSTRGGVHICKIKTGQFLIARDPAAAKGRASFAPLGRQRLMRGAQIWDGRFMITYKGDAQLWVQPAWGLIERLGARVRNIPPAARPTLPVVLNDQDDVIGVGACQTDALSVRWLGEERLMKTLTA